MKIVVTCGSPWVDLRTIDELLLAGGMRPALPAKRDALETIQVWHERVVTAYSDDANTVLHLEPISPSRPWEQMATEIFAANSDQACWGWVDAKSTWLLDFWLNYDPHFRFVLIYAAPHKDFARLINSGSAEDKVEEFIQSWLSYNRALLKFYNKHADRCVYLNYAACLDSAEAFGELCNEKFGLNLGDGLAAEQIKPNDTFSLLELLALQLLEPYQEVKELFAEMEATATIVLEPGLAQADLQNERFLTAVKEYQELREHALQLVDTQQDNIRLTNDKVNLEAVLLDMEQEQARLIHAQQQIRRELDEVQLQQQTKQNEAHQEKELLLLQIHQVQVGLEHCFAKSQSSKTGLETRIAELENEREQLLQMQHRLQQQLGESEAQRQTVQKDIQQENELLLLQIHQVQVELEHCFAESQLSKTGLEARVAELENEREQLLQIQHQLQQQLDQSDAQRLAVQKDIQQENELLLLQIYQVQVELEHCFVEYQAAQAQNQAMATRWQRLYQRLPDYVDYSAINVCDVEKRADYYAVKWSIDDFFQDNRSIAKLTLKTIVAGGSMGLLFEKEAESNDDILLSWPHFNHPSEMFLVFLAKQAHEAEIIFAQLGKLAATDWVMLKSLFNALIDALEQEHLLSLEARSQIDVAYWLRMITAMRQAYADTPAVFRFDKVTLYREQVNPDYEHLWFKFNQVRFADRHWPEFQFRLSAANVQKGSFSVYPKLEFPLSDDKTLPFEKWAIEIHDAMGERMELRFALAPPAIDIQVWNSFVEHDQALIASILQQLPYILEMVERQGSRISRSYEDWKNIVKEMQDVFKLLII